MRSGWAVTTDHSSSHTGDTTYRGCCEPRPIPYFAWGCFRDFSSGPCRAPEERPRHVASSASGHGNSKMKFIKCYLMVQLNDQAYFVVERFYRACPSGGGWPLSGRRRHTLCPRTAGGAVRLSQG